MFTPDQNQAQKVPFFEDAKKEDGWKGHTTTKSEQRLQNEIKEALVRLGGLVVGFQKGTFQIENQTRQGYRIHYVIQNRPSRLDIAALPVKDKWNNKKKEQSLKMALFMLEIGLSGAWFMQILSPGYSPLMPFVLTEDGKTISELWSEQTPLGKLLPAGTQKFDSEDVIDADVKE